MSTLTARIEALESKRGGAFRCWVSYDGGPYKSKNDATGKIDELTAAEVDALPGDNLKIQVIYASKNLAQRTTDNE